MKAAIIQAAGQAPVYADFADPVPVEGEVRIHVAAAALSHLAFGRASGTHYSSEARFPFVPGVDGVGRLESGQRVYFMLPRAPFGSMAEYTVVPEGQYLPLPDGLDDVLAAAMANPGMSSWAALRERAGLKQGETVLINGATGISGRLAIQIAKHLGAAKVIATGRNLEALSALGADITVPLVEDEKALEDRFREVFTERVDVVIDYLWGESARSLLIAAAKSGPERVPVRFVQVGSMAGDEIALPAAVLRSSSILMMGSGLGSVPREKLIASIGDVLNAAVPSNFQVVARKVALADIAQAWSAKDSSQRTVFVTA
ncbi:NADPH:quinone reductase-like Zn-dependent oxidoreductase [Rhizomicrobium palustre]|uniref:NADPH:quinone reductase-like Zn-dependent oxidoreductase n=1 Tax=Rhizomicrobium palustre TaxID=189966 RepID=A0A846MVH3_9PROT|nr:zinc-binding alcohol dehydrogenase family protein [Rhizomicrobium palustre]NIK87007.1 NADPH:quinone reductase-like Zn-dependent oxidoreductase [Rhizomicrobium palustre]